MVMNMVIYNICFLCLGYRNAYLGMHTTTNNDIAIVMNAFRILICVGNAQQQLQCEHFDHI